MALGPDMSQATELQRTSSLEKCAICDLCGRREETKQGLVLHLKDCRANRTCPSQISNIKTRGLYTCAVCPKTYTQGNNLKYHIRKVHFNLTGKITEPDNRSLNEVWLERVINSEALVEIRKVKWNMYLMKKATATDSLEISEPKDSSDVTHLYPTHVRKHRVWCVICQKRYYERDYLRHINETHNNIAPHECNNCYRTFKRPCQFLQHICCRKLSWKRKKVVDTITIID